MDFGALPPEVNSARIYAGPGSAPMLAAATAWDGLAGELQAAAAGYGSVLADLASSAWWGPSAAAMAAAAAPYEQWMRATAAQAEQAALQARAAAGAYEGAFAATVPPPVVAANRALLASLVATNFLGQNAPAIAATEAHYGQMWAQDAAAMYGYAGSSAAATALTPFSNPPETTNAVGDASRSAAATKPLDDYQAVLKTITGVINTVNGPYGINVASSARGIYQMAVSIPSLANGLGNLGTTLNPKPIVGALAPLLASPLLSGSRTVPTAVTGALGRAGLIGSLSVPATWATAVPAVKTAAVTLQASMLQAVPALAANGEGVLAGQMALSSLAGRALGTPVRQAAGATTTRAISAITHVTNAQTAPDIATTATVIVIPPIAK